MTKSRVQINRSNVSQQRPVGRDPGELYVNWADKQIGVVDPAKAPIDMVAVRFHSETANYLVNEFVIFEGELYKATLPSSAGPFNSANWQAYGSSVTEIDWSQIVNEPDTFPPTLPILQSDVIGLQDELAEKIEDAPSDGEQYARQNEAWAVVTGVATDWVDVTGKPATFPPTTPIAQASITNLTTDLAGKAPTVHTHTTADVTGLDATLTGKAPTVHTHAQADVSNLVTDLAGKAPTVHTHAQADITNLTTDLAGKVADTGDTMTGPLVIPAGSASATGLNFGTAGTGLHGDASNVRISAAGTNRMTVGTSLTMAIGVRATSGLVNAPGYTWGSDTDAGFYLSAAGDMRLAMAGADVVQWKDDKTTTFSGQVQAAAGTTAAPGIAFAGTPDMGIYGTAGINFAVGGLLKLSISSSAVSVNTGMRLLSAASATNRCGFTVPPGVKPTTPTEGDIWATTVGGFYGFINGVAKNLSIHVGTTAPASPITNDLWLDIT